MAIDLSLVTLLQGGGAPTLAGEDFVHKVLAGVLVAVIVGLGGAFWRMAMTSARYEERHRALADRVKSVEDDVAELPATVNSAITHMGESLREQMTQLAQMVERNGQETQRELRDLAGQVGFLKGRAEK